VAHRERAPRSQWRARVGLSPTSRFFPTVLILAKGPLGGDTLRRGAEASRELPVPSGRHPSRSESVNPPAFMAPPCAVIAETTTMSTAMPVIDRLGLPAPDRRGGLPFQCRHPALTQPTNPTSNRKCGCQDHQDSRLRACQLRQPRTVTREAVADLGLDAVRECHRLPVAARARCRVRCLGPAGGQSVGFTRSQVLASCPAVAPFRAWRTQRRTRRWPRRGTGRSR
jgi:hypothetical protein